MAPVEVPSSANIVIGNHLGTGREKGGQRDKGGGGGGGKKGGHVHDDPWGDSYNWPPGGNPPPPPPAVGKGGKSYAHTHGYGAYGGYDGGTILGGGSRDQDGSGQWDEGYPSGGTRWASSDDWHGWTYPGGGGDKGSVKGSVDGLQSLKSIVKGIMKGGGAGDDKGKSKGYGNPNGLYDETPPRRLFPDEGGGDDWKSCPATPSTASWSSRASEKGGEWAPIGPRAQKGAEDKDIKDTYNNCPRGKGLMTG